MNDLYLSCVKCREYTQTAYKWSLVKFREIDVKASSKTKINGDKLLRSDIWDAPSDDEHAWIVLRNNNMLEFLKTHSNHDCLVYSDRIEFDTDDEYWYDRYDSNPACPTARYFVEVHGSTCMTDVENLINNGIAGKPIWWGFESSHDEYKSARLDFENALQTLMEAK